VKIEIEEATKTARCDEEPSLSHLWSDVYSGYYEGYIRNIKEHSLKHTNLHNIYDLNPKT